MAGETDDTAGSTPEPSEPPTATPAAAQNTDTAATDHMIPKARFDEVNKRLRDAEKQAKEFEKQLAEFRQTQEATQQAELVEQGRWKELAEKNAKKLAEMQDLPKKLETYEATIKNLVATQREGLPEAIIELLDQMEPAAQLEWISKHKAELVKPPNGQQQPTRQPQLAGFNPSGTPGNAESDPQRIGRIQKQRGQMVSPFESRNR